MTNDYTSEESARVNAEVVPLNQAAHDCLERGELEECFRLLREAIKRLGAIAGFVHEDVALIKKTLAYELYHAGQYEEAEMLCYYALIVREKLYGPEHLEVAETHWWIGCLHDHWGKHGLAVLDYEDALKIHEKICGKHSHEVAEACTWLGYAHRDLGKYAKAEEYFRRALFIRQLRQAVDGTEMLAWAQERLGGVLFRLKRYAEALAAYEGVLALNKGRFCWAQQSRRRFNLCRVRCMSAIDAVDAEKTC